MVLAIEKRPSFRVVAAGVPAAGWIRTSTNWRSLSSGDRVGAAQAIDAPSTV